MMFGHSYGLEVYMEDFREKLRGLTSVLGDPERWVPLSFLLNLTCRVAALLGALGQIEKAGCTRSGTFLWGKLE